MGRRVGESRDMAQLTLLLCSYTPVYGVSCATSPRFLDMLYY